MSKTPFPSLPQIKRDIPAECSLRMTHNQRQCFLDKIEREEKHKFETFNRVMEKLVSSALTALPILGEYKIVPPWVTNLGGVVTGAQDALTPLCDNQTYIVNVGITDLPPGITLPADYAKPKINKTIVQKMVLDFFTTMMGPIIGKPLAVLIAFKASLKMVDYIEQFEAFDARFNQHLTIFLKEQGVYFTVKAKLDGLTQEINGLKNTQDKLKNDLSRIENHHAYKDYAAALAREDALSKQIKSLEEQLNNKEQMLAKKELEHKSIAFTIGDNRECTHAKDKKPYKIPGKSRAELENAWESVKKEIIALQNQVNQLQANYNSHSSELFNIQNQLNNLRHEIEKLNKQKASITAEIKNVEYKLKTKQQEADDTTKAMKECERSIETQKKAMDQDIASTKKALGTQPINAEDIKTALGITPPPPGGTVLDDTISHLYRKKAEQQIDSLLMRKRIDREEGSHVASITHPANKTAAIQPLR